MTSSANSLLEKMFKAYKETKHTDFPYTFYMNFPDHVLVELENNGYITQKHNVIGAVFLAPYAIQELSDRSHGDSGSGFL